MTPALIISLVGTLLPTAIQTIEKIIGGKSGPLGANAGQEKLTTVANIVMNALSALKNAKVIGDTGNTQDILTAIESVLVAMKQSGQIVDNKTPVNESKDIYEGVYTITVKKSI